MRITLLFSLLLLILCCESAPANSSSQETTTKVIDTPDSGPAKSADDDIFLKQKGDYSRLYALDETCRLTVEELATVFGFNQEEMQSNIKQGDRCLYNITYRNGIEGIFQVRLEKTTKDFVQDELRRMLKDDYQKKFLQLTQSQDQYIYKHPNQGFLRLYNPQYDNMIRIQFMQMLGSGLSKIEKQQLEERGRQVADFLIAKFQD